MPPKSKQPKVLKKLKKEVKTIAAVKKIAGRGDYRPSQFQRVRGQGDYFGDLLGGLGSKLGNWAQGKFRDITGFGDYRTHGPKRNSLVQLVDRAKDTEMQDASGVPSENPFKMGAMSVKFGGAAPRIQHREYIGGVYAPANPSDFSTSVYHIQPGLVGIGSLFPWGSSVFQNFEQYVMHGMVLESVSCSTNYSSTTALGTISMSTVYDAESQPLASLAAVNNNEYTTSAAPSTSFYHPIECAPKDGATDVKFVRRNNSVITGTDLRFDDVGLFQVSTSGLSCPAGTKVADIWASYDIEVRKAVLPDLHVGTTAQFDSATSNAMNTIWASNTPDPQNSLPVVLTNQSSASTSASVKVSMPVGYAGNYVVAIMCLTTTGNTWAAGIPVVTWDSNGSDITQLSLFPTPSAAKSPGFTCSNGAAGVAGTLMMGIFAFSSIAATASNNTFQLTCAAPSSSVNQKAQIIILPLDNDITDTLGLMRKFEQANPDAARLAKVMNQYQALLGASSSSSSSAPTVAATSVSRADSQWDEHEECKDLEASVHIDRKQLEALLSASSGSYTNKSLNQLATSRSVPSL
jgi:hypothetical protein